VVLVLDFFLDFSLDEGEGLVVLGLRIDANEG
jgi:hypothetical protein